MIRMTALGNILPWIQIILAVVLVGGILLQNGGAGLEGALGGGDSTADGARHTRRGAEKGLFQMTLVVSVLFVASAIASIFIY